MDNTRMMMKKNAEQAKEIVRLVKENNLLKDRLNMALEYFKESRALNHRMANYDIDTVVDVFKKDPEEWKKGYVHDALNDSVAIWIIESVLTDGKCVAKYHEILCGG